MHGRVSWFDLEAKYGFITPDRGGKDVYVSLHELGNIFVRIGECERGTGVIFDISRDKNGRIRACNVELDSRYEERDFCIFGERMPQLREQEAA
jgi:cold shock CspA family protein